jgi:hypothetical protein
VAALLMLVRHKWSAGMGLHFVLPSAALGAMMLVTEWRCHPRRSGHACSVPFAHVSRSCSGWPCRSGCSPAYLGRGNSGNS